MKNSCFEHATKSDLLACVNEIVAHPSWGKGMYDAIWRTASPHEWKWGRKAQIRMAECILSVNEAFVRLGKKARKPRRRKRR